MLNRKSGKDNIIEYTLCFFPFYGTVIGAVMYAFSILCQRFGFGQACFASVGTVIVLLMSGARHLKGFMNTADKRFPDGASAGVIAGMFYCMLYAGGLSVIWKDEQLALLGFGYMISRTLYSMAYVWFPEAESEKKMDTVVSPVQKRALRVILSIILAFCFCTCAAISLIMGVLEALLSMWVWTYYYYMSKRLYGGITKESAGYFLSLCELAIVLFVGMVGRILM